MSRRSCCHEPAAFVAKTCARCGKIYNGYKPLRHMDECTPSKEYQKKLRESFKEFKKSIKRIKDLGEK